MSRKFKKTVAIDFDGVIHSYISGWKGHALIPDPPVDGAREAIQNYINSGFNVVIYSTRAETKEGIDAICLWLFKNGFPLDITVTASKPPANIYIDDRGFCFKGKFPDPEFINNFKPWKSEHIKDAVEVPTPSDWEITANYVTGCPYCGKPKDGDYEEISYSPDPDRNGSSSIVCCSRCNKKYLD